MTHTTVSDTQVSADRYRVNELIERLRNTQRELVEPACEGHEHERSYHSGGIEHAITLIQDAVTLRASYYELLGEVVRVVPKESRHDTARRYIREGELAAIAKAEGKP